MKGKTMLIKYSGDILLDEDFDDINSKGKKYTITKKKLKNSQKKFRRASKKFVDDDFDEE